MDEPPAIGLLWIAVISGLLVRRSPFTAGAPKPATVPTSTAS